MTGYHHLAGADTVHGGDVLELLNDGLAILKADLSGVGANELRIGLCECVLRLVARKLCAALQ